MSLFVASLNSGSNGNCYYAGTENEAVLIDAGISRRETETRMKKLNLPIEQVKAVFISHEHVDHIRGVEALVKRYRIPVFITGATLAHSGLRIPHEFVNPFHANVPVTIGGLTVVPFSKRHDAADPYSFVVESSGVKAGVMTDVGSACDEVVHYFRQCNVCFLESNYDELMLEQGSYPVRLKNRIRGGKGHLSNARALELFKRHRSPWLTHLILSHLSANNNHPSRVEELFLQHAGETSIVVASRYRPSEVYAIEKAVGDRPLRTFAAKSEYVQMSLFA